MTIIDSQVHAYEANNPKRPWHTVPNWPDHVTGDEMMAAMDKVGVDGAIFISPFSMYRYGARIDLAALEQPHITGQPEDAVRIGAGQIGVEHGLCHGAGISLRQPAGTKGVNHDSVDAGSRNAAGGFGHVGHGELSLLKGLRWPAMSDRELSAVESLLIRDSCPGRAKREPGSRAADCELHWVPGLRCARPGHEA
jgi:hypothetical protein